MNTSVIKFLSVAFVTFGMVACGNSTGTPYTTTVNGQTITCYTGVACNTSSAITGSNLLSSGAISFTGSGQISNTQAIAYQAQTGISNTVGSIVQLSPKTGINGSITVYENPTSGYQGQISGVIQLSSSAMQTLVATYGASAVVTAVDISVVQNVTSTGTGYYQGYITQVLAYLYINGTPVQVVF